MWAFRREADVGRVQRIKRLKDVLGIPLSSIKRLAEVEETLDALGTELGGPLDPQQRQTRLLQARTELGAPSTSGWRPSRTCARSLPTASRGSSNSFTPQTRRSY
jgi:hypothetical protein